MKNMGTWHLLNFSRSTFFPVFHIPNYAILSVSDTKTGQKLPPESHFTFVSGNLLLGIESLGKFQNMPFVYSRLAEIARSFCTINQVGDPPEPICNAPVLEDPTICDEELMDTVVSDRWPKVDFLCFQEVWDRYFTYKIVQSLKHTFQHFVVDVAHHSWKSNAYFGSKFSNFFYSA